jgi:hypothetical protein
MEIEESNYQDTVVFADIVNSKINEREEQSIELVIVEIKPATEPVKEPATEPVKEPATEPVKEPATEPVKEPVKEPLYLISDEIQLQIPKRIYICHKNIECLRMTYHKWKTLNPNYEIYLFDDSMCEQFLLTEYSELHCNVFKFIPDGPIKSDFWRLCVLYKYGGIYVDADINPLIPLDNYLIPTSDFVTCITKQNRNFNPHFIASKKTEYILQLFINEYINMYNTKRHLYDYWKWSIVHIFNKYLNPIRNPRINTVVFKHKKFQLFIETTNPRLRSPNLHDYYCIFNNLRLFNSRYINYHPFEHQFKNENCVSQNNNVKYSAISYEMKNVLMNGSKINRSISGRLTTNRIINGKSITGRLAVGTSTSGRSTSGRNTSGRSTSGRSSRNNGKRNSKKSFVILFNSSKISSTKP